MSIPVVSMGYQPSHPLEFEIWIKQVFQQSIDNAVIISDFQVKEESLKTNSSTLLD